MNVIHLSFITKPEVNVGLSCKKAKVYTEEDKGRP